MRLKEDHMCNGQLKLAYNVNVATVSEYIVGTYVSAEWKRKGRCGMVPAGDGV